MKFSVACNVEGVADIGTRTVDTRQQLEPWAILFCERWLTQGGGQKGDPWSQKPVDLTVVARNASGCLLGFVIQGELAAFMFIISGKDHAADQAIVQQFRERCEQAGWDATHAAYQVPAPGLYLMCNPMHDNIAGNVVKGLEQLGDHLAAAFFNQIGFPL